MRLNWWVFLSLIPIGLVLWLVGMKPRKNAKLHKLANVSVLKQSAVYDKIVRRYRVGLGLLFGLLVVAMVISVTLMGRPVAEGAADNEVYNRDIVFCTDVSYSVFELNLDVIKSLKEVIAGLKGERFGVSMFNSSSVTVSPLTEDYGYVNGQLDKIAESIKCNEDGAYCSSWTVTKFIDNGTIYEAETRGGSLIGDGLVSCAQLFNTKVDKDGNAVMDESRTKIIVFSTDNELGTVGGIFSKEPGKPLYTLPEAMEYARKKGIIVYGIGTANIKASDEAELKAGVEKTGGKYYASANMKVSDIVQSIDSTSKSLLDNGQTSSRWSDRPEILAVLLVLVMLGVFVVVGVYRV